MKRLSCILFASAAIVFAADPEPQKARSADPSGTKAQMRKLGNVTWQPETHVLTWVVEVGSVVDGRFVAESQERYEVAPEKAFMGVGEEQRGIEGDEAVSLHRLLDTLALYCVQSVNWWDRGKGVPLAPGKGTQPTTQPPNEAPKKQPVREAKSLRLAAKVNVRR